MKQNRAERLRASMHHQAESLGNLLVEAFHYLALFAIGATVFWRRARPSWDGEQGACVDRRHPPAVHLPRVGRDGRYLLQDQSPCN